jgi:ribosomal protein S14
MKEPVKKALPTTSKYSHKNYKCTKCGKVSDQGTNHYGFIYPACRVCGNTEHECLEPVPEGMGIPEKWKKMTLGDLVTITERRL